MCSYTCTSKIHLTDKKTNGILTGRKVDKVTKCIVSRNFDELGITEEQFDEEIEKVKQAIISNKKIRKSGTIIDDESMNDIIALFKRDGKLYDTSLKYLNHLFLGVEERTYIINKFNEIKFKLISKVSLSDEESIISPEDVIKLGSLNENNHLVGDTNRYLSNVSELLINLNNDSLKKILRNKELLNEVSFLLPYVGLIEELDVNTFIKIASNYDRIKKRISENPDLTLNTDVVLKNLNDIITLANDYESVNDLTLFALGKDVVSIVGDINASSYLEHSYDLFNKQESFVPPISLETPDLSFKSGDYSNPERLSIPFRPKGGSCIGWNSPMSNEVLLEKSGDLVLIKNKKNEVVSRFFLVRRGNLVYLITSAKDGQYYPSDVLKSIGDQIIQQSIECGDNIDYVFVSKDIQGCKMVEDRRFINDFPHADMTHKPSLISSKNMVQGMPEGEILLDFDAEPKKTYPKQRSRVMYDPNESQISRIKALSITMEKDPVLKEKMSQEFEPCFMDDYIKVVCGEDWYIGIRKDGSVEEVVLQTNDANQMLEFNNAKEMLITMLEEVISESDKGRD